jgi:ribosome-associated protein
MQPDELRSLVLEALDELKGVDIVSLDVGDVSGFTDHMVIASGTSTRHVKSLADNVIKRCREAGVRPLGTEGETPGEWILVDLGDVVLHVMLPDTRAFYNIEKLWSVTGGAESDTVTG